MPKDMFGPVTRTAHKNKSYNYQSGGSVIDPDEHNRALREFEDKLQREGPKENPVSDEMMRRSHDVRRAWPGDPTTYSARASTATGGRESENVEDRRKDIPYRRTIEDVYQKHIDSNKFKDSGRTIQPPSSFAAQQFKDVDKLSDKLRKTKMKQPNPEDMPQSWEEEHD